MSVSDQLRKRLRNIGIGQTVVIKQKSVQSTWGGYPGIRTIVNEIIKLNQGRYLHTVVDNDRVIVVRLPYDAPKPDRTYDERLKNEY